MLHVPALPGTPQNTQSVESIADHVLAECEILEQAGVQALMLENMHDRPYLKRDVGPEITAAMAVVCQQVRSNTDLPLGIQILAGANREAVAVAKASSFQFVRAEGFVFGHLADEGFMESDAGELLRYRKQIGAEDVAIFTDIKKKHSSHSISSDVNLIETADAAQFFLSDGLIITGTATGQPISTEELNDLKSQVQLPLLAGSGITADNLTEYWNFFDAFIVGSYLKEGGNWANPLDPSRISTLIKRRENLL